jgi:hypothetical protein
MERVLQLLDDLDDLLAAARQRLGWWPGARRTSLG